VRDGERIRQDEGGEKRSHHVKRWAQKFTNLKKREMAKYRMCLVS
jgi:hypothetical protein